MILHSCVFDLGRAHEKEFDWKAHDNGLTSEQAVGAQLSVNGSWKRFPQAHCCTEGTE